MSAYIVRRLLLIFPTLLGIMTINFFIIQIAPGGPVDQMISILQRTQRSNIERITGSEQEQNETNTEIGRESKTLYKGASGLHPDVVKEIEKMYGFDKPILVRYVEMLKNYFFFDFGESFFRGKKVVDLIIERMPVSVSLGIWSTLIIYFVSIPLGIKKAITHGSRFDVWTSTTVILGNAIPGFLFSILLIVAFAGGSYFKWFPLRGMVSMNFDELSFFQQIFDYFWHLTLPIIALVIGGFAALTMLTKNSFLDEINKQYVVTARAKGLSDNSVLYRHVFRNGMLIIIAGFPSAFIGMFFTGSVLIEVIFSLEGLGLLGYEATLSRDYPIMFGTLYMFTLLGLIMGLIGDLMYTVVDHRIDFESRKV